MAEPIGLGDRELRDGDGRRMVIGDGSNPSGSGGMADIVEEAPPSPAAKHETKTDGAEPAPRNESGGTSGEMSYADAARHREQAAGDDKEGDGGEENGGDLSRKNSRDRLLD